MSEPSEDSAGDGAGNGAGDTRREPEPPRRLVFRIPRASLLAVAGVLLFAFPFAAGLPWLWLVYVLPVAAGYAVLRLRTIADGTGVVARTLTGTAYLPWDEVASLRLAERHWVRAVRTDGREVALPSVRLRHLPALALVSGGRITDPTETAEPTEPTEPTEATDPAEAGTGTGEGTEVVGSPEAATPTEPTDTARTAEPGDTAEAAQPADTADTGQTRARPSAN